MHALTPPEKYHCFLFLKTSSFLLPLHPFSFLYLQTSLEGDKSWTLEVFDGDTAWMVLGLDSKMCCGRAANPQSAVRRRLEHILHVQIWFRDVVQCGKGSHWAADLTLAPALQASWNRSGERVQLSGEQGTGSAGEGCGGKGGCRSCGRVCIRRANWETAARSSKPACGGDQTHNQASEVMERSGTRRDLCNPLNKPLNLLGLQEIHFPPSEVSLVFQLFQEATLRTLALIQHFRAPRRHQFGNQESPGVLAITRSWPTQAGWEQPQGWLSALPCFQKWVLLFVRGWSTVGRAVMLCCPWTHGDCPCSATHHTHEHMVH